MWDADDRASFTTCCRTTSRSKTAKTVAAFYPFYAACPDAEHARAFPT
jgi:hypothetical protein